MRTPAKTEGARKKPHKTRRLPLAQSVGEAMLEGLVVCRGALVCNVNDSLCRMLGRSPEELIGTPATQYLGALAARASEQCGTGGARFEAELATKPGGTLIAQISMRRVPGGWFALLTDMTTQANALRRSEGELRLLSAQLLAAQELERQRIARELHDGIGQALGGIKFSLENCDALMVGGTTAAARDTVRGLAGKVHGLLEEVRRIAMDLRPATLDDLGVLPTIGWFTREFRGLYGHIRLDTIVEVREEQIVPHTKTALYRIVQEALNNVVSHADAQHVSLSLRLANGHVELEITDDGTGFDPARFAALDDSGRGLGLASMRERAESTGARFLLESRRGRGTTVRVRWPSFRSYSKAASARRLHTV